MRISDQQVDIIARRLAERISSPPTGQPGPVGAPVAPAVHTGSLLGEGVFATVDDAVKAAAKAYLELDGMSLEGRKKIITSIRETMLEHAEELARHAHQETGLGRFEHKVIKNRLVTRKTSGTEVLTPQAVTGDNGLTLTEYAPYGVIGAITPTTNPTSTIICNTIAMLAAGNSIVFNVHPNARECSMANVRLLHRAIMRGGGPANLVTTVAEPSIESAQAGFTVGVAGQFFGMLQHCFADGCDDFFPAFQRHTVQFTVSGRGCIDRVIDGGKNPFPKDAAGMNGRRHRCRRRFRLL
ncbi:MAG: aldehyde dehydrogenase family protein [Gammaproteobacteria bacterium]|nr:aldehyde dehydrogenase family protein [Gammaproteobacteria bacterium]